MQQQCITGASAVNHGARVLERQVSRVTSAGPGSCRARAGNCHSLSR
jgi:hypothetical protein